MHEEALLRELVQKVQEVAVANGGGPVRAVRLWVGALSHLSDTEVGAQWPLAARGTSSEGALIEVTHSSDLADPRAQSVVLVSVDVVDRRPGSGARGATPSNGEGG